jgi:hypothetical protein
MRGRHRFVVWFLVVFALATAGAARGYHTRFVADNCNDNAPVPIAQFSRNAAVEVALYGRWEGYQWAGGCWDDDDRDDSPGDPPGVAGTGGEGPDCSGFTFKVWREPLDTGSTAFHQWWKLRFVHGPYTAESFKNGVGAPHFTIAKSNAFKMDAFASTGHIGMIYSKNADGTDQIIEAKGEAYGTNIWTRTYRGSSSYGAVRRAYWATS